MMIPFTKTTVVGSEMGYISEAIASPESLAENGKFSKLCTSLLKQLVGADHLLLTGSCTQALEIVALLLDLKPGDEVIMPSFTFTSTANAFMLQGAKPVFVDIDQETLNISPLEIKKAITKKTKAIVPVHYAGVACDMSSIIALKNKNIYIIEDAAQAYGSFYKKKPLRYDRRYWSF